MTDKKTIWHEPTESVQEKFIIAIIDEKLYPFFGVYYLDEGSYLTKAQDWSDVERWCYLDDLLELSNKAERLENKILEYNMTFSEYNKNITEIQKALESEVSRYKNALEVARAEYLAIIDSEFDSGDGEQIKAFMANYDKLIQDTIKASQ